LALKLDGDFFTIIPPAPDRHSRILLKHHVVGEQVVEAHLGGRGDDTEDED
jgi:hypothetical protein